MALSKSHQWKQLGREMRRKGHKYYQCPFARGSKARRFWTRGWFEEDLLMIDEEIRVDLANAA